MNSHLLQLGVKQFPCHGDFLDDWFHGWLPAVPDPVHFLLFASTFSFVGKKNPHHLPSSVQLNKIPWAVQDTQPWILCLLPRTSDSQGLLCPGSSDSSYWVLHHQQCQSLLSMSLVIKIRPRWFLPTTRLRSNPASITGCLSLSSQTEFLLEEK